MPVVRESVHRVFRDYASTIPHVSLLRKQLLSSNIRIDHRSFEMSKNNSHTTIILYPKQDDEWFIT